ncbi:hypothetical protein IX307_001518 [Bacteroides pyogenes]|nr:hypothetical protein [Bacteroides pyogenes]MBR8723887.1 hypothetical protein [Bacteroides pyogenes]MBR8737094.1 hypothetical protein [Bacteroides pyogenes]MBR8753011.1 hypothetical protein [Bacteroides pyogenes]MBR8787194.1 hypothetical protein [Bacteroides pyogenes]
MILLFTCFFFSAFEFYCVAGCSRPGGVNGYFPFSFSLLSLLMRTDNCIGADFRVNASCPIASADCSF